MSNKYIITILALLNMCIELYSQQSPYTEPRPREYQSSEIGIRFMPTFSAFKLESSSNRTISSEVTLGLGVGGMLAYNFNNHVGMQVEVIYNTLSQKFKDQNTYQRIAVNYVNIPILMSLNSGKSKRINLNLVAGPQFGISLGSRIGTINNQSSDSTMYVFVASKNDFGFAYGAGLEVMLNEEKNTRLGVGFRGVYGFSNISDEDSYGSNNSSLFLSNAQVKTYSGYLGLSFIF